MIDSPKRYRLESNLHPASILDRSIIQAYLETRYRVLGDRHFTLEVGQVSTDLLAAHKTHNVECSAFLTACNPFSRRLEESENVIKQAALGAELKQRGLVFLTGVGEHRSGDWPGEDSFLVLGLDLEAAKVLGTQLEQNGFVWSGADGVPQLILLR